MKRSPQNNYRAAKQFNRNVGKTKRINISPPASRGGYRL